GYARLLGRALVQHRFPRRIAAIDGVLHGNTFSMTLLLRLLPVGSNLVTNLAAGVSSVRMMPFVAGSALGYVPQTLVFALAGSGVQLDAELRIAVSAGLFIVSGALGVMLYRRYRRSKRLDEVAG
ncbi:MAG: VTT domain-containing protein, partial [Bacteroidales bacterium]|nr:VTT domain-containing protein [Bacteroidales bacterium]